MTKGSKKERGGGLGEIQNAFLTGCGRRSQEKQTIGLGGLGIIVSGESFKEQCRFQVLMLIIL